METHYQTARLRLRLLEEKDAEFMLVLLNTPGWIRNIRDSGLGTTAQALAHVRRIMDNPDIYYYVLQELKGGPLLGVATWIKREYLDYPDIGFGLLPDAQGRGYALEAARCLLEAGMRETPVALATTRPDNQSSQSVLRNLGFIKLGEITIDTHPAWVFEYRATAGPGTAGPPA